MKKSFLLIILLSALVSRISAQQDTTAQKAAEEAKAKVEELKDALNGLNESYLETKATVDALKKIKISGYIQAQYQSADMDGISSFA